MGGYYSVIGVIVVILVNFFLFNEMNNFMAERIFDKKHPVFHASDEQKRMEKRERLKAIKDKFRYRVSLEGINDLHDIVEKLEGETIRKLKLKVDEQEETIR